MVMMMRGEPLVHKLAMFSKYVVFPSAMIAAFLYSRPDYNKPKKSIGSPN